MDGTAIVLTLGKLDSPAAKTAHGLVRGSERYKVVGVIDDQSAGEDAGEVIDGIHRNIPIFSDLSDYFENTDEIADYCIIGIASAGGKVAPEWIPFIKEAIQNEMSIVCGMHEFLSENSEIADLAEKHDVQIIDVRKPKPREELHFWTGEIHKVLVPIIPVLGTDCAVGKRTTARFLVETCQQMGINAQMIYTGQTGWMQGGKYGFVFDSTLNDFVSGELEHAILTCYRETDPDVIFVEGQAALRNPSGPCGSELLVSGLASGVVLIHPPGRKLYKGWEFTGREIPPIENEIALINMYGVETLGVAINTQYLTVEQARVWQKKYQEELNGIPAVLPIQDGVADLVNAIKDKFNIQPS